jgi:hypothetical protein
MWKNRSIACAWIAPHLPVHVTLAACVAMLIPAGVMSAGCTPGPVAPGDNSGNGDDVEDNGNANENRNANDNVASDDDPPVTEGDWYRPPVQTTWQWQLQPGDGGINVGYDVDVYDVDLFDTPASLIQELQDDGRRVICYFSAGSFEDFRGDADAFSPEDLGDTLDGFADERWLDIRSSAVAAIMRARLEVAAEKGCDGVEPDNVDGYANETGFPLTARDQLAFNRFIANEAHRLGLSVGLKNDLDQIPDLRAYFDFAVNEQCHEFDECDTLTLFIADGKPVFNAEYADPFVNDPARREEICTDAQDRDIQTLVLPLDLDDSFRFTCDP